jgi:molybdopterin synthase sulfur carrier subunit
MKILYFASLKESLGMDSETIEFAENKCVLDLKKQLSKRHGRVFSNNLLCAVNQEISSDNTLITPNDEVAFYPPVTGG